MTIESGIAASQQQAKLRLSRFHDEKGNYALKSPQDIVDCLYAFLTTLMRKAFGWRPSIPWIALPAWRYIKSKVPRESAVFEWGSGMSTVWYERHFREVNAVEDNPIWYGIVSRRLKSAKLHLLQDEAYVTKISDYPDGYFDLVVIDGNHRLSCFNRVGKRLKPDGILLIDNSDKDRTTLGDHLLIDRALEAAGDAVDVKRFTGWTPGNFFPQETTLVQFKQTHRV